MTVVFPAGRDEYSGGFGKLFVVEVIDEAEEEVADKEGDVEATERINKQEL